MLLRTSVNQPGILFRVVPVYLGGGVLDLHQRLAEYLLVLSTNTNTTITINLVADFPYDTRLPWAAFSKVTRITPSTRDLGSKATLNGQS